MRESDALTWHRRAVRYSLWWLAIWTSLLVAAGLVVAYGVSATLFGRQPSGLLYIPPVWAAVGLVYWLGNHILPRRRLRRSHFRPFDIVTRLSAEGITIESSRGSQDFPWESVEFAKETRKSIFLQYVDFSAVVLDKGALTRAGLYESVRDMIMAHTPKYVRSWKMRLPEKAGN